MKKYSYLLILVMLLGIGCTTQETFVNNTRVSKLVPGIAPNPIAVDYALPRTVVTIEVITEKRLTKPGPFAQYAERYLGVTDVPTRDMTEWTIREVKLSTKAEKDPDQVYRIEREGISRAGYVSLNDQGVICGVNVPVVFSMNAGSQSSAHQWQKDVALPGYSDLTLRKYTEPMLDTVYRIVRTDTSFMRLPLLQSLVSQKTLMNQAEEAANLIMELRERRFGLLTGEYAYDDIIRTPMPEGYTMEVLLRELAQLEYDYVSLFVGRVTTETHRDMYKYLPKGQGLTESEDLFTFSRFRGVLPAGSSNGDPVKIKFERSYDPASIYTNLEYDNLNGKKEVVRGLAYRVPGKALADISLNNEVLVRNEILVAQYGVVQFLPADIFNDTKLSVEYHSETGLVKRIFIPLASK
ncbi:MAG: DUF4831 family protein [Bacteroidetes bacterium]|nr:DUF4831 family protein [Bacteroidota bacterium]MBT3747353.1 DUF4831 family protein [Bacteroidota bacterium]MBT4398054.1 DUF4831 family protein [Bacteroidota bacterium]MBT4408655.1 DUF4831 family protein [Bacteroidota bacterium]MBT7093113.1 DUF4831 family protein [Bacteroidota bacterium]